MANFILNNKFKTSKLPIVIAAVFVVIVLMAMFHSQRPETLLPDRYIIDQSTQPFTYQPLILESVTFIEIFWLLILGFISGIIGGMLGMGGGLLKVSGLYLFF